MTTGDPPPPPGTSKRANIFGSKRSTTPQTTPSNANSNGSEGTEEVAYETRKISTFSVRMTASALPIGHDMKRFLAIIMPRHNSIKVHPHTKDISETLENFDLFPVGKESEKYIFDVKRKSYGKRVELDMSINIESELPLNQIKFEPHVFKLLKEHSIFVNARKVAPAVTTKAVGCLWNLDPKRTSRYHIMEELKFLLPEELQDTYMYLTQHRYKWKTGTTVNIADMFKLMIDVNHADAAGLAISKGLQEQDDDLEGQIHEEDVWYALRGCCLLPLSPIREIISPDEFTTLIQQHNKMIYETASVTVDNMWNIDTKFTLTNSLRNRLQWPENDDLYEVTFRELFTDTVHHSETGAVKDCYVQRGKMYITCRRDKVKEVSRFTDDFFEVLYDELDNNELAHIVGNHSPNNPSTYPGRSGTLIYGTENTFKALINTHMDKNLNEFQTTLKAGETLNAEKKLVVPNYARPPRGAMYPRGSRPPISVNPEEFRQNAVESWAQLVKQSSKKTKKKQKQQKQSTQVQQQEPKSQQDTQAQTASQTSSLTANTQYSELKEALAQMNTRFDQMHSRALENENRIAQLESDIINVTQTMANIGKTVDKAQEQQEQMFQQVTTITHEIYQLTQTTDQKFNVIQQTTEAGFTSMRKWFERADNAREDPSDPECHPSKKVRTEDDSHSNSDNTNTDNVQMSDEAATVPPVPPSPAPQPSHLGMAHTHVQVSDQSSTPPGNNTDQTEIDDSL